MSTEFEKLTRLLRELFQLDAEDLDFGMYRVLRLRRLALRKFLDETLAASVRAALGGAKGAEREGLEAKVRAIEETARRYGGDPARDPDYA